MRIDVVSIFPDYLAPLRLSLVGKGVDSGRLDLRVRDLREHTHDRHRTVDDTPYGGGPGMVMRPEPWGEALTHLTSLGEQGDVPHLLVPARAYENQVFVAYANCCGPEAGIAYGGLSAVAAPDGRLLAQADDGPALLVVDLELSQVRASPLPYLADRRPDTYAALGNGDQGDQGD